MQELTLLAKTNNKRLLTLPNHDSTLAAVLEFKVLPCFLSARGKEKSGNHTHLFP